MASSSGSATRIVKGMVQSDVKLDGKTTLITGCNTGVGYETALDFARRGARVIMACRNTEKAEEAKAKILEEVKDADLVIKKLDLSSLESVRECAKDVNENESRLDILVNNAGIMLCPPSKTKEDYEIQLGVNHIGHFLFTNLILDLIKKSAPSRIVILSSSAYKYFGKIDWNDIMQENSTYNSWTAYGTSKLANILHCLELSKRLEGTGVTCYTLHPGAVKTDLQRHTNDFSHLPFFRRIIMGSFFGISKPFLLTPQKGAQTTIYCSIAPELEHVTGKYYANCAEERPSAAARNEEHAKKLWELSEEWTKPKEINAQKSDAQETNVQETDAQETNVQKIDAQKTDAQDTEPQDTNVQETDAQETGAQETNAEDTNAQKIDAQKTDAQETDAQETDAQETDAQETDAQETDAQETNAQETDPQETDAQETDAQETDPQETDPQETNAQETDVQETS